MVQGRKKKPTSPEDTKRALVLNKEIVTNFRKVCYLNDIDCNATVEVLLDTFIKKQKIQLPARSA